MSDERLQALERRWRESGAVEDEVALLRERLRLGLTTVRRLELAADLGSAAAARITRPPPSRERAAWEEESRHTMHDEGYLRVDCTGGYDGLDREAALRSVVSALPPILHTFVEVLPAWLELPPGFPTDPQARQIAAAIEPELRAGVRACQEQCLRPSAASPGVLRGHVATLQARAAALVQQGAGAWDAGDLGTFLLGLTETVAKTGVALLSEEPPRETLVRERIMAALFTWKDAPETTAVVNDAILHAHQAELLPWLLGHGDPARAILEARAGGGGRG